MSSFNFDGSVVAYIEENLSPKSEERESISERYNNLSKILKGVNFQSGSYARFTAITPVNDLDVIWALDPAALKNPPQFERVQKTIDPIELDISSLLYDLADRLREELKNIGQAPRIKPQTHSVGIFYGKTDDDFSIDIVPALPSGDKNEHNDDIYLVPEIARLSKYHRPDRYRDIRNPIKWLLSDPKGYIKDATELNNKNDLFRKTAKLVKTWKYSCKQKNGDFPLKSFHLELIVTELYKNNMSLGCFEGICNFFDQIDYYLDSPHFPDRADASRFVDDYLNNIGQDEWTFVKEKITNARTIIAKIKNVTGQDEIGPLLFALTRDRSDINASVTSRSKTRVVDAYSKPYYDENRFSN
jgi:hypothetical protein